MTEESSAEYLKKIIKREENENDIRKIAQIIGGWPLSLKQASGWIKINNCTAKDYCDFLENQIIEKGLIVEKILESIIENFQMQLKKL